MEKVNVRTESKAYDICIESGLFHKLPDIFKEELSGRKLAVVSDHQVFGLYGRELFQKLTQKGFQVKPIVFEAGEQQKNLSTLTRIYGELAGGSFTRSDIIIALGGGVTGDMAGLAAATFLRGMGFIQIPTSLLAMVDSSIGGKVAVDLPQGKNLVGAFYQPDMVYTDPAFLNTLPDNQFADGMAELLKHGFIRDALLCRELISSGSRSSLTGKLDAIIARSCRIKRDIVEKDELDNGLRQLLNFGHTIGHAIERVQQYSGFTHGQAVSAGMVVMTRLTEKLGLTGRGVSDKLKEALALYGLPVAMPPIDTETLLQAIRLDKKIRSGRITIAYIEEIGAGKLLELDLKELEENLNGICENSTCTS